VLEIASSRVVTSSITNEAVDDLKLRKGRAAYAVIKASDVMVAIDQ
jgi:molybdopterin-binding protein